MKNVSFKEIFVSANLILAMSLLVMCGTSEVKVTPKPEAQATPQQPAVQVKAQQLKVIDKLTIMIHFDFNQAALDKEDIAELNKAVVFVKKYPKNKIHVDAYSDIIGTEEYNIKLSERRAVVTKDYLLKNAKIHPANITFEGRGTVDPIGDRKTEAGRAMNRRAVISIISD
jgi:OOP family OmpA-OmpF porin